MITPESYVSPGLLLAKKINGSVTARLSVPVVVNVPLTVKSPTQVMSPPTFKLPVIFAAVKLVIEPPEPEKFVAVKILLLLSQLKLSDCITLPVALPTNSFPATNVPNPVPPHVTAKVPKLIFDAFKLLKLEPEPV